KRLRRHIQDQAADTVRQHLPLDGLDHSERTVLETRIGPDGRGSCAGGARGRTA
ncbi:hypothetical protein JHN61_35785, partial [Streptomyces sp. MBT67]|nr:hypothetical protein [Streptomyces sp. MBT67]